MDSIRIKGGRQLKGSITICGAKNAALPLMATSLLTEDTVTLSNLPHLLDITTMANLLSQHGVAISMNGDSVADGHMGRVLELTCSKEVNTLAPYELVRRMRASVLVLGPLLAKHGKAKVSLPGGCAIGTRPVDLHLAALQQMGAEIEIHEGYIHALAPKGLKGAHIIFPKVSVGATENILMAATLAEGETVIANAAREPEVSDLAHCLVSMGAEIEGIDSGTLRVKGKPSLHGTN
jgi:UDP-N-acetylglucosamine 1-carboxyvinyltransferase